MKFIIYYVKIILFYLILWIILSEKISITNIIIGFVFSIITIFITEKILKTSNYKEIYKLSLFLIIKYVIHLFFQIYSSGFFAIKKIISGNINPDIVEISTDLNNDFLICILANSITLTPGTVTVEKDGKLLKVLWLNYISKDNNNAGRIIKGKFEDILKEGSL